MACSASLFAPRHAGRRSAGTGSARRAGPGTPPGGTAREKTGSSRCRSPRGAVVQVDVGRSPSPAARQRRRVHREAVVLRGDLDAAGGEVLHRLVGAVVAELQLVRAAAERQRRGSGGRGRCRRSARGPRSAAHRLDEVRHRLGIAGAVREEDAVRLALEHRRPPSVQAGTTVTSQPAARELAQDVQLDAGVVGDDLKRGARRRGVAARRGPTRPRSQRTARSTRDLAHQVAPDQAGQRARPLAQAARASRSPVEMMPSCAPWSRRWRVRARVSMPWMPTMPCVSQVGVEASRAPRQFDGHGAGLLHDEAVHPRPARLDVLRRSRRSCRSAGRSSVTIWPRYDGSVRISW